MVVSTQVFVGLKNLSLLKQLYFPGYGILEAVMIQILILDFHGCNNPVDTEFHFRLCPQIKVEEDSKPDICIKPFATIRYMSPAKKYSFGLHCGVNRLDFA